MKKRILIVTPRLPYPLFSGGDHAQYHFIEAMRMEMNISICFEINSLEYTSNYADYLRLKELWNEVTFFPLINIENTKRIKKTIRWLNRTFFEVKKKLYKILVNEKSEPIDFVRYNSLINQPFLIYKADFTNHLASIVREYKFDIIQIDFISLSPLIYILPNEPVKVLVHHEIRYIRVQREAALFENQDYFDECRIKAIKEQELALLNKFDKIITLTETDKEILANVIPQNKLYFSPATIGKRQTTKNEFVPFKNKLVFIGSSIHLPNKDGIKWFIDFILPLVILELPDVQLNIIGYWEKRFIKLYAGKNVHFSGFVEDLDKVMQSSILIVPIRIGSGMRLKIIEAINHNIPFITTSIGVEGLDFENKRDCLIADIPEEFARAIVALSHDANKQETLVKNSAGKLLEIYSFDQAVKKRMAFYKQLL